MLKLFLISKCIFGQLKGFEFIKAVHLDPVPFDLERDLLTPTFKKKRPQMLKYYQVLVPWIPQNSFVVGIIIVVFIICVCT